MNMEAWSAHTQVPYSKYWNISQTLRSPFLNMPAMKSDSWGSFTISLHSSIFIFKITIKCHWVSLFNLFSLYLGPISVWSDIHTEANFQWSTLFLVWRGCYLNQTLRTLTGYPSICQPCSIKPSCAPNMDIYWWLSARLQYLQCKTAVSPWALRFNKRIEQSQGKNISHFSF